MIAMKEAAAVEKLTRGTVLLTKVTIVFLPLSLLTAYFSMQIGNIETRYSLTTYWVSFAVISVLMLTLLIVYGLMTGTLEGEVLYRSATKTLAQTFARRTKRSKVH
jgi:hypothetical protein